LRHEINSLLDQVRKPLIVRVSTKEAKIAHIEGAVDIHIVIGTDGRVMQATLLSGVPILAMSAIEAIRQWQHEPILLNGIPVEMDTTVTVSFRLN
jgi:TonB family protein